VFIKPLQPVVHIATKRHRSWYVYLINTKAGDMYSF